MIMYRFHPALIPAALFAFLAGCSSMPPPSPAKDARAGSTVAAVGNGSERTLQKGMTAEAVKRIMGEPAEIKPMQSAAGKAEVWLYRRTSSVPVQQVQVSTRSTDITTIGGDGQARVAQRIEEPVFAQQIQIIDETISLLMFDDKLIEQKESVQKRLEYK
jgi:hypothetical protein